jgi:6-phosphogluconate dehydrogenase
MEIGVIGLGRMGANMARRMARAGARERAGGVRVVAFDRDPAARAQLAGERNIECVEGLAALASKLAGERVLLVMLPAGAPTEDALRELLPLLSAGDTLVDGGNAFYRDSMARSLELSQRGLRYVDAGVSGGIHGLANGYCLMLGGTPKSVERFEPFARILAPAPDRGWLHCGPSGAGHFAKMIHNGI